MMSRIMSKNRKLCLVAALAATLGAANTVNAAPGTSGCSSSGGSASSSGSAASASTTSTSGGSRSAFYVPATSCGPGGGGGTVAAPELDSTSSIAALTLVAGSIAIMVGRRLRRAKSDAS
jgi:hypothetical protein